MIERFLRLFCYEKYVDACFQLENTRQFLLQSAESVPVIAKKPVKVLVLDTITEAS